MFVIFSYLRPPFTSLGSWWWAGRPGVLRFMGLQRVGHDWATELNWRICPFLLGFPFYWHSVACGGFPDRTVGKESACSARRPQFDSWVGKIHWRRDKLPTHSSILGLPYGSAGKESAHSVGKIPWRSERLSTPVFWPREFHGLYSPCGCKESDTTEWLSFQQ